MSAQIKITVDGQVQQVAADQRPTHLFQDNAEIVVCKINGELKEIVEYDVEGERLRNEFYYYNGNIKSKWDAKTDEYIKYTSDGEKYENNDDLEIPQETEEN